MCIHTHTHTKVGKLIDKDHKMELCLQEKTQGVLVFLSAEKVKLKVGFMDAADLLRVIINMDEEVWDGSENNWSSL